MQIFEGITVLPANRASGFVIERGSPHPVPAVHGEPVLGA